jgi:hypothetical protein
MKKVRNLIVSILILLLLAGCAGVPAGIPAQANVPQAQSGIPKEAAGAVLALSGDGIEGTLTYTFGELSQIPEAKFEGVYSVINNWPTVKFVSAKGIKVAAILRKAGVMETAKAITFKAPDGYEQTLTAAQLFGEQFNYPKVAEGDASGATPVEPVLAYAYKEKSEDISEAEDCEPNLIIGQHNVFEHNNPLFVEGVSEIIVSSKDSGRWEKATTFPAEGPIAKGEKVKLQHKSFGLVKLHYTVDGSDPTALSPMYNPSTYQPELTVPITIEKDTVIKVLVEGAGKKDSEIATFKFMVK